MSPEGRQQVLPTGKFFYGWVIALCCTLITVINGAIFYTFSVFFKPVAFDFGWSRGETAANYTVMLVAYAPGSFFGGRLADRHGSRLILLLGALLIGIGFIGCSRAPNLIVMVLCYAVLGLGLGTTLALPTATIQRWFVKWRGLMVGIVFAGTGAGGFIFAPLVNYLITIYDWRAAYLITGIVFGGIIAASASFLVSEPKMKNLKPFGSGSQEQNTDLQLKKSALPGLTSAQAFKSGALRGMVAICILTFIPFIFIISHMVPYVTDRGISAATGAQALGLTAAMSVIGRLAMSWFAGRIGWIKSLTISCFISSASIIWLIFVTELGGLYLFVVFYGIFQGSITALLGGATASFFGLTALSELLGFLLGIGILVAAIAPWLSGLIFDLTGSYLIPIAVSALFFAVAGVLSLLLKPPRWS